MDLLTEARRILEASNYSAFSGGDPDVFYFEDQSLLGFVWVASSPGEILSNWPRKQEQFLREKDSQLRTGKEKSWNAYSVMLTPAQASKDELARLAGIQEDFRGTRKIVRSGLEMPTQVERALFPLISIRNLVQLEEEDVEGRLRARLSSVDKRVAEVLLGEMSPEESARALLEKNENTSD